MRTTLTIDDQLLDELKERAHREGVPLKQVVNQVLRRGLNADGWPAQRKPYRVRTHSIGQPLVPGLEKSLVIAAALEDEEFARKLAARR